MGCPRAHPLGLNRIIEKRLPLRAPTDRGCNSPSDTAPRQLPRHEAEQQDRFRVVGNRQNVAVWALC